MILAVHSHRGYYILQYLVSDIDWLYWDKWWDDG